MSDEDDDIAENATGTEVDPDRRFIVESGIAAQIAALAEPVIEAHGFRLVRVVVSGRDGGTVQVMAERAHGQIDVADLTRISRDLSPLMDAHDPISERYFLEVSSPGIDRPLVRAGDFEDWAGYEAKLKLKQSVDGRKRFRGIIEGFENGEVLLRWAKDDGGEEQVLGFAPSLIEEAKLVMTDELIRAALAGHAAQKADADDEEVELEDEPEADGDEE
jgi:ribosome maturation factor RimP